MLMLLSSGIVGTLAANVDLAPTGGSHGANARLYFVKPSGWSNVSMLIGHDTYSEMRTFTKLSGNLYYLNMVQWDNWTQWVIIDATGWGSNNQKPSDRIGGVANKGTTNTSYAFNANNTYLLGTGTSHTYYSGGYSSLNSAQTAYSYAAEAGSSSYSANAAAGTVTVNSYALSGNGTGSSSTATKSATATSVSRNAARVPLLH